jgi:hypothetical protein
MVEAKGKEDDSPLEDKARGDLLKILLTKRSKCQIRKMRKNTSSVSGQNVKHSHNVASVQVGSFLLTNSEAKLCIPSKKKPWGDHVEDEEDSLPSPMAKSAPSRVFGAPASPAAAEVFPVFSTTVERIPVVGAAAAALTPSRVACSPVLSAVDIVPVEVPAVSMDHANVPVSPKNLMVSFDGMVTTP